MRRDRADKLRTYAQQYLEPVLQAYPDLKGSIHLALRKQGWFAEHQPVLHVIVREEDLDRSSPWRIRSITAHELSHLIQHLRGISLDERWNKRIERQATFNTFVRGFAYDFLRAFPAECTRQPCDHKFVFGYFRCDGIFGECCRDLNEAARLGFKRCIIPTPSSSGLVAPPGIKLIPQSNLREALRVAIPKRPPATKRTRA